MHCNETTEIGSTRVYTSKKDIRAEADVMYQTAKCAPSLKNMDTLYEWRPIPGFKGMYEVSDHGTIRSCERQWLHRNRTVCIWKARPISLRGTRNGYLRFDMHKAGKRFTQYAHIAVALAFIPNKGKLPVVNHKDGNKQNNHVSNLEWVTSSDNTKHYYERF